jgi:hypothetical protein
MHDRRLARTTVGTRTSADVGQVGLDIAVGSPARVVRPLG